MVGITWPAWLDTRGPGHKKVYERSQIKVILWMVLWDLLTTRTSERFRPDLSFSGQTSGTLSLLIQLIILYLNPTNAKMQHIKQPWVRLDLVHATKRFRSNCPEMCCEIQPISLACKNLYLFFIYFLFLDYSMTSHYLLIPRIRCK